LAAESLEILARVAAPHIARDAERIIQDAYVKDDQLRKQFGDHVMIELITDLTVSFFDRVVKRAQEQKLRRSKGDPSQ